MTAAWSPLIPIRTHTADRNAGTTAQPASLYDFRLKLLKKVGAYYVPDQPLTPGIVATVSYFNPDTLVSYSGPLWEIDAVEVVPRKRPTRLETTIPLPEQQIFAAEQVDIPAFQRFLRTNNLALIVSRNVTTRDRADKQQPYNLHVTGSTTQTSSGAGKVYDVSHLQLFQGDQIRGIFGGTRAGRRVLAQNLHGPAADWNGKSEADPLGSVRLGADGSMAAFVPARRALTWQLTDSAGAAVVRERYWLTFQPGEVRSCTSCHGVNRSDQAGHSAPTNPPEALRTLLRAWKAQTGYTSPLRFSSAVRSAGGRFALQASAPGGQTIILERSSNLRDWTPVQTNQIGSETGVSWDLGLDAFRGFYRFQSR